MSYFSSFILIPCLSGGKKFAKSHNDFVDVIEIASCNAISSQEELYSRTDFDVVVDRKCGGG